ncbi:MAG: amidohydrolase family protein [Candidatus Marinimicrobia bacterium]|nr:amidohydrolase family protein [Candidatus Neomarinimicrobiota bacterium]MCF7829367.1 amidohydrolase family protein [Candidatus Neomarinimicrobiota bacterium]MCF7880853.1 amidohydrolase family protein [Candidatus Neomarinimicrobiota bacterium]
MAMQSENVRRLVLRYFLLLLFLFGGGSDLQVVASDQIPAPPQDHPIALKGGTIHPVSGPAIPDGTLLFSDGKIDALGTEVKVPEGAEVIDISGQHIYPGFIAATSTLGLVEIPLARATRDFDETGNITPEVRAEVAINPDSELLPVARSNGITTALTIPQGGLISGTSAAILLDGWTWEDMTLQAPVGLHIRWPSMRIRHEKSFPKSVEEQQKAIDGKIERIRETFRNAAAYQQALRTQSTQESVSPGTSVRWEAMFPVLDGDIPVFVHANEIRQIQAAVDWADEQGVDMVLVGGQDAWRVTDLLRAREIPVILESTSMRLPARNWEGYDTPMTAPKKLHDAGVPFCISLSEHPFASQFQRNLPYEAAAAAAYGLPREVALKAVTLYPAQILGIADRVGSLEPGKDATFIITDGDPLEITTQVRMEFIQGRKIDLSNRQTALYRKYRTKYQQLDLIEE